MLPLRLRRQDPNTLTWEYLDGTISPKRAELLSRLLQRKPRVRERFVESAVMHGMLFEYYRNQSDELGGAEDMPGRSRRHGRGRSSAA